MDSKELAEYCNTTHSQIVKNFPTIKHRFLQKGILITKNGKGSNAQYSIEKVAPIITEFVPTYQAREKWTEDYEGEIWIDIPNLEGFEISNYARVRNKDTLRLHKASAKGAEGYKKVSILGKNYPLHRLVLLAFNPIENPELYTVDHIDGNRSNNKLENLRWASIEENTMLMVMNRKELNKELTRLLHNHSYDEVLKMLQKLK